MSLVVYIGWTFKLLHLCILFFYGLCGILCEQYCLIRISLINKTCVLMRLCTPKGEIRCAEKNIGSVRFEAEFHQRKNCLTNQNDT